MLGICDGNKHVCWIGDFVLLQHLIEDVVEVLETNLKIGDLTHRFVAVAGNTN